MIAPGSRDEIRRATNARRNRELRARRKQGAQRTWPIVLPEPQLARAMVKVGTLKAQDINDRGRILAALQTCISSLIKKLTPIVEKSVMRHDQNLNEESFGDLIRDENRSNRGHE